MNLQLEISLRVRRAIAAAFPSAADAAPLVVQAQNAQFGDYQSNAAMGLGKRLGQKPREVAQKIIDQLDLGDLLAKPEIAGPGFINLRLRPEFLAQALAAVATDDRLGVPLAADPRTVVVDFGGPNTCKPMHVGHLRSPIIGDAICRLLRFLGHKVVGDNHLGDWGTQFGLLIAGFRRFGPEVPESADPLERLVAIYKLATALADQDESFRAEARAELAKLQAGDPANLAQWRQFSAWSLSHFNEMYARLGVHFDETLGESSYNSMLAGVVEDLKSRGLARPSEGAICVFWDDEKLPPLLIQKSDGAFLYATTDLATLKYRCDRWHPSEIVIVTDARQQLHFNQIFDAARRWGIAEDVVLRHVFFGTILGPDGRPLKTRSGDLVALKDVLDEAENRALAVVRDKSPDLSSEEMAAIARVVGIGAIKYADLSQNHQSDFVFNWDKMLALQGNTAPYLQYAYARIRSILRKGNEPGLAASAAPLLLTEPAEAALALKLLRLPEAIDAATDDFRLNLLSNYLFELSAVFTTFYESCPVLKSDPAVRAVRLRLCDLTARVLKQGLDLLGIDVVERM